MKRYAGFIILFLLCVPLILKAGAVNGDRHEGKDKLFVSGHVIVKFNSDALEWEKGRVRGLVSGQKGRRLKRTGIEKIHLPPGWDEERAVEVLSRDPSVESVQVDYRVELLGAPVLLGVMSTVVPNDSLFSQQWYLDSPPALGWFVTSTNTINVDVDIDAPEAWAVMAGMFDSGMTVAVGVIDSGCGENGVFDTNTGYDPGHIDLPNSVLFANTIELPADDLDSVADTNSLIDDANGWDFADDDNTPADAGTTYHGTLISGIIGADWDNGQGVAGIGKGQLQILPLRFIDSFFNVVAAVEYAINLAEDGHAVRVLNLSFKSENGVDPSGLFDAVLEAQGYGIAIVAAAGNDNGNNNDDFLNRVWPAEYTRDPAITNVLAVAATRTNGALAGFSNYGPNSVQIAAPGDNIYSTYGGNGGASQYARGDGTSFSTPIAGAVLGLVMAAHPGMLPAEAIDRVLDGGDFDARLAGLVQSGKRVNLAGALAPFYPYSGLVYLDSTITVGMHNDTISTSYGSILSADIDMAWSTTPKAADMVGAPASTLTLTPTNPGIAQFTLYFSGASAPVGTYDTGPWRVTAIRPFTAQIRVGETIVFTPILTSSPMWSVTDSTVASISASGVLTGLQEGITRVILSDGSTVRDYSGQVLVLPPLASSNGGGGGGCGITSSPGDPYIPGLVEMMLMGTLLFMLRRRWLVMTSPMSKAQSPKR